MQRPGKRERARRKNSAKFKVWSSVLGADVPFLKYGKHKSRRVNAFLNRPLNAFGREPDNPCEPIRELLRAARIVNRGKVESGQQSQTA